MRLIIHIGANKTGTTAIQSYFTSNRDRLARLGICYPKTGARGVAHYDLSNWLGFGQNPKTRLDEDELRKARCAFHREIRRARPSAAVVSSEIFMLRRDPDRVRWFFDEFEVEVYAMLRRHDEWWPSLWSQAIKTVARPKWPRHFEGYLEFQSKRRHQHFNYRDLFETWDKAFPGRVTAVPFEAGRMPNGVVSAFLDATGLGHVAAEVPPLRDLRNVSPRLDALSLIDLLQRAENLSDERRRQLVGRVAEHGGNGQKLSEFLSGRIRRRLVEENLADYAHLAAQPTFPHRQRSTFFEASLPEDDGRDQLHELSAVEAIEMMLDHLALTGSAP